MISCSRQICAVKGISPISQLLRYKSRELDSSETIEAIGIGKDDEIECEELEEGEMGVDMGGRMEGFGGTALVGNAACPQCTLLNPNGSATCQACDYVSWESGGGLIGIIVPGLTGSLSS